MHEFHDYKLLENHKKFYLRTLEDTNRDGRLNNNDKVHYYRIEFGSDGYEVIEYYPTDLFDS